MPSKYAFCLGFSDQYSGRGYTKLPFAYKNVADIIKKLKLNGYTTYPTIIEADATRKVIKEFLLEKISLLNDGDWLLFYYVGHGDIKYNPNSGNNLTTYLVTSFNGFIPTLGIENFFKDDDYQVIIDAFQAKCPQGHLITILDCCYAFGLIDTFSKQVEFHTIIAASTYDKKAYYDTNSFFYQGFETLWDEDLETISKKLQKTVQTLYNKSKCQCQIAKIFKKQKL